MKVLIDIPEEAYNRLLTEQHLPNRLDIEWCIIHGTPLPDNATNGDIMQMIFPNGVTAKFATFMRFVVGEDEYINCNYDWWNALYER